MKNWITVYADTCWEDYGGLWALPAPDGSFYFIRFTNMLEETGDKDLPEFLCELQRVNPFEVDTKQLDHAMSDYYIHEGVDETLQKAAALVEYGLYSPLDSWQENINPLRLLAKAKRKAAEYINNQGSLDAMLDRPVNKIGSTAREFGRGDIDAGLKRYAGQVVATGEAPDIGMNIMLKMHGIPVESLKEIPYSEN